MVLCGLGWMGGVVRLGLGEILFVSLSGFLGGLHIYFLQFWLFFACL